MLVNDAFSHILTKEYSQMEFYDDEVLGKCDKAAVDSQATISVVPDHYVNVRSIDFVVIGSNEQGKAVTMTFDQLETCVSRARQQLKKLKREQLKSRTAALKEAIKEYNKLK